MKSALAKQNESILENGGRITWHSHICDAQKQSLKMDTSESTKTGIF